MPVTLSDMADKAGNTARADRTPAKDADLDVAWRLAYVISGDKMVATTAFAEVATSTFAAPPRIELLAATLRRTLDRAVENRPEGPPVAPGSAVTSALWELPARQRAALWLTEVVHLTDDDLAKVLGLAPDNVEHVANRAARWLDVALDHKSGPLCQHEPKLGDYIGGNLPLVEAAEIDDHLAGCATCTSKVQAYEELADLPAVLDKAVPRAPAALAAQAADRRENKTQANGLDQSDARPPVPPAVRPLAACCAGLLAIGLVGVVVLRTPKATSNQGPVSNAPSSGVVPAPRPGLSTNGRVVPPGPAATAPSTTSTTAITVTFPTLPPGGTRTTRR
jgi:hypothetical protein